MVRICSKLMCGRGQLAFDFDIEADHKRYKSPHPRRSIVNTNPLNASCHSLPDTPRASLRSPDRTVFKTGEFQLSGRIHPVRREFDLPDYLYVFHDRQLFRSVRSLSLDLNLRIDFSISVTVNRWLSCTHP